MVSAREWNENKSDCMDDLHKIKVARWKSMGRKEYEREGVRAGAIYECRGWSESCVRGGDNAVFQVIVLCCCERDLCSARSSSFRVAFRADEVESLARAQCIGRCRVSARTGERRYSRALVMRDAVVRSLEVLAAQF